MPWSFCFGFAGWYEAWKAVGERARISPRIRDVREHCVHRGGVLGEHERHQGVEVAEEQATVPGKDGVAGERQRLAAPDARAPHHPMRLRPMHVLQDLDRLERHQDPLCGGQFLQERPVLHLGSRGTDRPGNDVGIRGVGALSVRVAERGTGSGAEPRDLSLVLERRVVVREPQPLLPAQAEHAEQAVVERALLGKFPALAEPEGLSQLQHALPERRVGGTGR